MGASVSRCLGERLSKSANGCVATLHVRRNVASKTPSRLRSLPVLPTLVPALPAAIRCFATSAQTPEEYTAMIHACAKAGESAKAEWWFEKMRDANFDPDLQAYNTLLDACAVSGSLERAERVLASMLEHHEQGLAVKPDVYTYCALISACDRAGRSAELAEGYFAKMLEAGIKPSHVAYNTMIGACASTGDADRAERWLKAMEDRARDSAAIGDDTAPFPDAVSYNSVISACTKAGSVERAATWLGIMRDAGVWPDVVSYTTVMSACATGGMMVEAERWLAELIRNDEASTPALNCMIDGYAKLGDVEMASAKFDQIRQRGLRPNASSYNTVINAHVQAGDMAGALARLAAMQRGSAPIRPDLLTYTTIIGGLALAGKMRDAEEWLTKMQEQQVVPNQVTFAVLLRGCAKRHDVRRAERLFGQLEEHDLEPNDVLFNLMLDIYARDRSLPGAEATLRDMQRARISPDIGSYGTTVKAAARTGDVQRAEAWVSRMVQASCRPDRRAYGVLLSACSQVGDVVAADSVLARARAAGYLDDVVSYTAVIGACIVNADLPRATQRLADMKQAGVKPNAYTINAILNVCEAAGDVGEAERLLLELIRQGAELEVVGFNSMLRTWASRGDPMRAGCWMDRMTHAAVEPDIISYNTAINACARAGDASLALELYDELQKKGLKPMLGTYRALVKPLAQDGDHVGVYELLRKMEETGRPRDPFCARALISACANAVPPAAAVAEEAFRSCEEKLRNDNLALQWLAKAVGQKRYQSVRSKLVPAAAREQSVAMRSKLSTVSTASTIANKRPGAEEQMPGQLPAQLPAKLPAKATKSHQLHIKFTVAERGSAVDWMADAQPSVVGVEASRLAASRIAAAAAAADRIGTNCADTIASPVDTGSSDSISRRETVMDNDQDETHPDGKEEQGEYVDGTLDVSAPTQPRFSLAEMPNHIRQIDLPVSWSPPPTWNRKDRSLPRFSIRRGMAQPHHQEPPLPTSLHGRQQQQQQQHVPNPATFGISHLTEGSGVERSGGRAGFVVHITD